MADAVPAELTALLRAPDPGAREAAWAVFVQTHSRLLLHVSRRVARDYDAAMDAYTYLLEQLHHDNCRRLRGYTPHERTKFTTWLVVVARRLCLDHVRQRYGRPQDAGQEGSEGRAVRRRLADLVGEELDPSTLTDPAPAADPETQLRRGELKQVLASALSNLAPRDRLLLKLRFEDGLSAREIARILGLATPFHVYRRLQGLFFTLREALARQGVRDTEA
ncbi:MAG TPA: sigma-70 family RNA polymerase sigma factor [Gemmatimonadales bacterium]|jgi:RNA polymerase sigma factor (sigma-70 family)|nr:sigma-70 family RNA polymerase sigma factor [Gemmatimonadales bacterium]